LQHAATRCNTLNTGIGAYRDENTGIGAYRDENGKPLVLRSTGYVFVMCCNVLQVLQRVAMCCIVL